MIPSKKLTVKQKISIIALGPLDGMRNVRCGQILQITVFTQSEASPE